MELDGNAQEKPLSLTRDAYQHVDIACKTRPGQKIKKTAAQKKAEKEAAAEEAATAADGIAVAAVAATQAPPEHPVLYVRVDPECEWLAAISVTQQESMWVSQLEKETSVAAQAEAVQVITQLVLSLTLGVGMHVSSPGVLATGTYATHPQTSVHTN